MAEPEIWQLLLAAALPAPFAFRLGAVTRDGRELLTGTLYLALGGGTAALVQFLTGSLLLAVPAALAPVLLLAHARFLGAHRAPPDAGTAEAPDRSAARTPEEEEQALPAPLDALHAGMAFVGDLLESADRVGELRHKRRLRKLERQQAERQVSAPVQRPPPERRLAARVRRDGPLWDFKKLPPPE